MSLLEDGISQADHEAAVTRARTEGHAAGLEQGRREGSASALSRINTILASDKVKGKESLAIDLTCTSPDMAAEAVISFIDKVPALASSARPPLAQRVEATGVGAVAPGTAASSPTGNAGASDADREREAQLEASRKKTAAMINAERGLARTN